METIYNRAGGSEPESQALSSLQGLSVGDAFGETFFREDPQSIQERSLPPGTWNWTDDTHMALSIVEVLLEFGRIEQDKLARLFAEKYSQQPWRGYGGGARRLLGNLSRKADWREEAPKLFSGGSYGNGAAMRAAPIGAYYTNAPQRAAEEAEKSAMITHFHPEGRVGAMAVAAAAALFPLELGVKTGAEFLEEVAALLPESKTRAGIEEAVRIPPSQVQQAASKLGTGMRVAAFDTVPFCLWVAAHHADEYENALWVTVSGSGDMDTTCAIVGGIIGAARPAPPEWIARREPLLDQFNV